jgi:hypothetical protein
MRNVLILCAVIAALAIVSAVGGADPSVAGRFAAMLAFVAIGAFVRAWAASDAASRERVKNSRS